MKLHLLKGRVDNTDEIEIHYVEPCCDGTRLDNPNRTNINSPMYLNIIDPRWQGRLQPFAHPHIYAEGIGVVRFCPYCGKQTEIVEDHIPSRFEPYKYRALT